MTPLTCPQCAQVDQVRSVQSIYDSQSGVTHSWELAVGGVQSHGIVTSNLALRLCPPPEPRQQSAVGCGTAFVLVGALCAAAATGAGATKDPGLIVIAIGALCVVAVVITKARRREQTLKQEYKEYAAAWPAMVEVWQRSMACLRCHGVFFPPNAPLPGFGARQLIPIDAFHAAVTDIGARLVLASPEPPDRKQPLPPAGKLWSPVARAREKWGGRGR